MARILIVGVGNPLRSDDGLGWHVASELSREVLHDEIDVISTQQLTPEIADLASHAQQVLFIDAAHGSQPGTFNCEEVRPSATPSRHSHDLSPAGILRLARELYGRCPPAHLLTIVGESFAAGEALSAAVAASVPALKAKIRYFLIAAEKRNPGSMRPLRRNQRT